MKLYQFLISIIVLNYISIKIYLLLINLIFMLEYYHRHKFISNKYYEKIYLSFKKINFTVPERITNIYNYFDYYWNSFKNDFNEMIYEKFQDIIKNDQLNKNKHELIDKTLKTFETLFNENINKQNINIDNLINEISEGELNYNKHNNSLRDIYEDNSRIDE